MSREMDHLSHEVAQAKSVMASATTLIAGLAGHMRANSNDPAAIEALAADLDASAAALASAVTENTPAANIGTSEGTTGEQGGDVAAAVDEEALDTSEAGGEEAEEAEPAV